MANSPNPPFTSAVGPGGGAAAAGLGFQSQIGASFALAMLNERPVDHALSLGDDRPIWIRSETEAPVDDILIATLAADLDGLHFHDLRGTTCTLLAEAGATPSEIAAMLGWTVTTVNQMLDTTIQ